MSIALEPLRLDQYEQTAKWEWGDDVDVAGYATLLTAPNRLNFGVYRGGEFCGFISLERFGATARFHVSKERHSIHPQDLADMLITMGDYLFRHGIKEVEAAFSATNRAARRLAIRSWMNRKGEFEQDGTIFDCYAITRDEYYGRAKIQADQDSIPANQHLRASVHSADA